MLDKIVTLSILAVCLVIDTPFTIGLGLQVGSFVVAKRILMGEPICG